MKEHVKLAKKETKRGSEETDGGGGGGDVVDMPVESKPKRVRTGCRTCRDRHLKCDEVHPTCQNCRKSNKDCSWEFVLKWYNNKDRSLIIGDAPALSVEGLEITFEDMSRYIAEFYVDGENRYPPILTPPEDPPLEFPIRTSQTPRTTEQNTLPPIQISNYAESTTTSRYDPNSRRPSRHSHTDSDHSYMTAPSTAYSNHPEHLRVSRTATLAITSAEEALFMQVYTEEVGLWMDSMNALKHFSEMLPHEALSEPMLYNALLACGARHLSLVNPAYSEAKAFPYYDTATTLLLRALQNPERDTVRCATTAVCLNVYEIMSERAMQRMNHIAGARALIKECGWNARSRGIGAACFWLNVGMEILSCLHFNWQVAWDPDLWGIDMAMLPETELGREEFWVHRMLYIIAKISNFRASIPRFQEASPYDEQMRLETRHGEWQKLMALCANWDACKPKTMEKMIRVAPEQGSSTSCFPEIWLTGRAAPVGQLFYHTAMCLLAQINPLMPIDVPEMNTLMSHHAHEICSIVAHSKDRGIASVAIRSLAIAAECLTVRPEQEEVLEVFESIRIKTGWRISFINDELKKKWGWNDEAQPMPHFFPTTSQSSTTSLPPPPPQPQRPAIPSGILNPLLKTADFSLPNHPYQQHYQPPSQHNQFSHNFH